MAAGSCIRKQQARTDQRSIIMEEMEDSEELMTGVSGKSMPSCSYPVEDDQLVRISGTHTAVYVPSTVCPFAPIYVSGRMHGRDTREDSNNIITHA